MDDTEIIIESEDWFSDDEDQRISTNVLGEALDKWGKLDSKSIEQLLSVLHEGLIVDVKNYDKVRNHLNHLMNVDPGNDRNRGYLEDEINRVYGDRLDRNRDLNATDSLFTVSILTQLEKVNGILVNNSLNLPWLEKFVKTVRKDGLIARDNLREVVNRTVVIQLGQSAADHKRIEYVNGKPIFHSISSTGILLALKRMIMIIDGKLDDIGGPLSSLKGICPIDIELRPHGQGVKGKFNPNPISWIQLGEPSKAAVLFHVPTQVVDGIAKPVEYDFPLAILQWMDVSEGVTFLGVGVEKDIESIQCIAEKYAVNVNISFIELAYLAQQMVIKYNVNWTKLSALFLYSTGYELLKGCMSRHPKMSTNIDFFRDILSEGNLMYLLNDIEASGVILDCLVAIRVLFDCGLKGDANDRIGDILREYCSNTGTLSNHHTLQESFLNLDQTLIAAKLSQDQIEEPFCDVTPMDVIMAWNQVSCDGFEGYVLNQINEKAGVNFTLKDMRNLRTQNAKGHIEITNLLHKSGKTESLKHEGLGDCLKVFELSQVFKIPSELFKLMTWFEMELKIESNQELSSARKIISEPDGIAYTAIILNINDCNILEYLGLAKISLKFRLKLAKVYGRTTWLKEYKNTGRDQVYDKERFRIRQRFNKGQRNLERGSRNEWLLKTWANELRRVSLISEQDKRMIMQDLNKPVTYMEFQDHRDYLLKIAKENNVLLSGNNEWVKSATRKALFRK